MLQYYLSGCVITQQISKTPKGMMVLEITTNMKQYTTEKLNRFKKRRIKLLAMLEVINQEIEKNNKDMGMELVKTFGGKNIVFTRDNNINYLDENGNMQQHLLPGVPYMIIEVMCSMRSNDIVFTLESSKGGNVVINNEEFHSFKFIEDGETDTDS